MFCSVSLFFLVAILKSSVFYRLEALYLHETASRKMLVVFAIGGALLCFVSRLWMSFCRGIMDGFRLDMCCFNGVFEDTCGVLFALLHGYR